MDLNAIGEKIFRLKYSVEGKETWDEACIRVASYIASAEKAYGKTDEQVAVITGKFFQAINELVFLPGGRILANSGTGIKNLMNCFVLPIKDSRTSIYNTLKNAAEIFAMGGGIGYNFSNIRETGALIKSTGGQASGPLSFMTLYDQTAEVIQQASRRGAQMGVMNVDHPDIIDFIEYKSFPNARNRRMMEEYHRNLGKVNGTLKGTKYAQVLEKTLLDEQLTHFNVSVGLTEDFMRKAANDKDFDLISRQGGGVTRTLKANDILKSIAEQAWKSGDPGVFFLDRANDDNMVPYMGKIEVTNPCVTGDTKIHTVYEGAISFKELAERGEDILVYSFNPETKLMEVDTMVHPRKTRERAEIIQITFDSGLVLRCTPDHNLYSFRGGKIKAKYLEPGQSIRAFSMSIPEDGHLRVHGWVNGKTKHQYVARMVWEYYNGKIEGDEILHHIDFDKLNNHIDNFELLSNSIHNMKHYPMRKDGGFFRKGRNHKVVSIEPAGYEDVYNGTVINNHSYIIADDVPIKGVATGIVSANCGEVPLLPYETCCLGSLNLTKFYDKATGKIDWEFMEYATRLAIRFLDNVQEISETGIKEIDLHAKGLRRLGLGVMGWADLLSLLELEYNSDEAFALANYISWHISFFSWLESMSLAQERGVFSLFERERINWDVVKNTLQSEYVPEGMKFNFDDMIVRNISVTSIAPTGSIALLAGVNSSIEPYFALAYKRNITEGIGNIAKDHVIEINQRLFDKLTEREIKEDKIERIKEWILEHGTLDGCEDCPEDIQQCFLTSHELTWQEHVAVQASWQDYVTNAVSKTINCTHDTTVEEIMNMYIQMWESGLKGGTIYRDGSKSFQILNVGG
jgi:ribonucleoside-diphosphate reductase alpha chain